MVCLLRLTVYSEVYGLNYCLPEAFTFVSLFTSPETEASAFGFTELVFSFTAFASDFTSPTAFVFTEFAVSTVALAFFSIVAFAWAVVFSAFSIACLPFTRASNAALEDVEELASA